jgi:hypothetical protein
MAGKNGGTGSLRIAAAAIATTAVLSAAIPIAPAHAQVPYLGVDFGNGFGIGLGPPPSSYGMAPASPLAPLFPPPRPYYYRY